MHIYSYLNTPLEDAEYFLTQQRLKISSEVLPDVYSVHDESHLRQACDITEQELGIVFTKDRMAAALRCVVASNKTGILKSDAPSESVCDSVIRYLTGIEGPVNRKGLNQDQSYRLTNLLHRQAIGIGQRIKTHIPACDNSVRHSR